MVGLGGGDGGGGGGGPEVYGNASLLAVDTFTSCGAEMKLYAVHLWQRGSDNTPSPPFLPLLAPPITLFPVTVPCVFPFRLLLSHLLISGLDNFNSFFILPFTQFFF